MEDKLEAYRLRKRRTETVKSIKNKIFGMLTSPIKNDSDRETKVKIEVIN